METELQVMPFHGAHRLKTEVPQGGRRLSPCMPEWKSALQMPDSIPMPAQKNKLLLCEATKRELGVALESLQGKGDLI